MAHSSIASDDLDPVVFLAVLNMLQMILLQHSTRSMRAFDRSRTTEVIVVDTFIYTTSHSIVGCRLDGTRKQIANTFVTAAFYDTSTAIAPVSSN